MTSVSVFNNAVLENSVLETIFSVNFNVLDVCECDLVYVAYYIIVVFLEKIGCKVVDEDSIKLFVAKVKDNYNNVPYHNFYHAIHVLNMTYCLMEKSCAFEYINPLILFATLVSSLTHDIGHTGTNNDFHIKTMSNIALTYNNLSVLEQYHCSLTFQLIDESNLVNKLTKDEYKLFRNTIIQCILATDLNNHKSLMEKILDKIPERISSHNQNHITLTEQQEILIVQALVHCADLSNPTLTFDLCSKWAVKVNTEFSQQTEHEIAMGLKPSFNVDPKNIKEVAIQECNYIKYICKPYWGVLNKIFEFDLFLDAIDRNLFIWKSSLSENVV